MDQFATFDAAGFAAFDVAGFALWAAAVAVYFLPGLIGRARRHHNSDAILLTNLLLGWTGLGWVVALIWAVTATRPPGGRDQAR